MMQMVGVDPVGSVLTDPTRVTETGFYEVEGVGDEFLPTVCDRSVVDVWMKSEDRPSFMMARRLIRQEGLLCGVCVFVHTIILEYMNSTLSSIAPPRKSWLVVIYLCGDYLNTSNGSDNRHTKHAHKPITAIPFLRIYWTANSVCILAGGSSGSAMYCAIEYARKLDADKRVVVLLADGVRNYMLVNHPSCPG